MGRGIARVARSGGALRRQRQSPSVRAPRCQLPIAARKGGVMTDVSRWPPPSGIIQKAFPKLFRHDFRSPMTQPLPPICYSRTSGTRRYFKATKTTVRAATSVSFAALRRRHSGRSSRFASEVAQFSAVLSPTGNRRRMRVCRLPVSPRRSRSIERCPSGGKAQ